MGQVDVELLRPFARDRISKIVYWVHIFQNHPKRMANRSERQLAPSSTCPALPVRTLKYVLQIKNVQKLLSKPARGVCGCLDAPLARRAPRECAPRVRYVAR
jgi:hypothetical protein